MAALVIHTPTYQVGANLKDSFDHIISTGIGNGFALNKTILRQMKNPPINDVIILDKSTKRRATGKYVSITSTGVTTGNRIERYYIKISNIVIEDYKSERLNRNGVAVV